MSISTTAWRFRKLRKAGADVVDDPIEITRRWELRPIRISITLILGLRNPNPQHLVDSIQAEDPTFAGRNVACTFDKGDKFRPVEPVGPSVTDDDHGAARNTFFNQSATTPYVNGTTKPSSSG